jgi:hypothetical protein
VSRAAGKQVLPIERWHKRFHLFCRQFNSCHRSRNLGACECHNPKSALTATLHFSGRCAVSGYRTIAVLSLIRPFYGFTREF